MMNDTERDDQTLVDFWDKVFSQSEEDPAEGQETEPESWKDLAPSEKLFAAACSLGQRKKVLDYGCGDAWAGIIAAKSGCPDVTAADAAPGAVRAAERGAFLYGVEHKLHAVRSDRRWLGSIPENTYDGFICSNVLDVVPEETALEIIRESARITTQDASVIIGLNYYLSPDAAAARGLELKDGRRLYVNGVLRLVSRTDEEWAELFSPWYTVQRLTHFAWPGEKSEARRLFYLKKRDTENGCVIRPERKEEEREVENLIRESFWNVYRPGCSEHYVIHVLRDDPAFVRELDFVMEQDGRLIGQNMFMRTVIGADDGRTVPVLTMGPIGIIPELKRRGYGKKILDYSLEKAAAMGFGAVLFEGNIGFYGRSGFDYARKFGIRYHDLPEGADDSFFLCRELIPGYLDGITGVYQTPQGYYVDDADVEEFDKAFPPREKLKLPGQIFD